MKILTNLEFNVLIGKEKGSHSIPYQAAKKLRSFQARKTSADHIAAVNALITEAEKVVHEFMEENKRECKKIHNRDFVFHQSMNKLAREAGLRC